MGMRARIEKLDFVMRRVLIVSEVFWPDEVATGHYMTRIALGLAEHYRVAVICTTPGERVFGEDASDRHIADKGIELVRVENKQEKGGSLWGRPWRSLRAMSRVFSRFLDMLRPDDLVLVVTNPPSIPSYIAMACRWKKVPCVIRVDDVYPEAIVAAGVLGERNPLVAVLKAFFRGGYKFATRIITIGRDVQQVLEGYQPVLKGRIDIVPNWADLDTITPAPKAANALLSQQGLSDRFVVLVAGNIGRVQGVDTILDAARRVQGSGLHVLFIGGGAMLPWAREYVQQHNMQNVSFLPPMPRERQTEFLNACDVAMLSLKPKMYGIGVPSRLYNYFAAAKPVIAVVDQDAEPALVIRESDTGWVVPAGNGERLAEIFRQAMALDEDSLRQMGLRARHQAEARFSMETVVNDYVRIIGETMVAWDGRAN